MSIAIKANIKIIILVVIFVAISSFSYYLYNGISINEISKNKISIKNIFIKFDGQITLKIGEFKARTNSDDTNRRPKKLYQFLLSNLNLFKYIKIDKIIYNNDTFSILYNKKTLFMSHKDIEVRATVVNITDKQIQLSSVITKGYNKNATIAKSKIVIFLDTNKIQIDSIAKLDLLEVSLLTTITKYGTKISLKTNKVASIKFLNKLYKNDKLDKWLYSKIKCKSHWIDKIDIYLDKDFYLDKNKTYLNYYCLDAKIKYHSKLEPVLAQLMNIEIKNTNLSINFLRPHSNNIKLDNSYIYIKNIFSNLALEVFLKSKNTKIDTKIQKILNAYDINVPIIQLDSTSNIQLHIKIPFDDNSTTVYGNIKTSSSNISISNMPFYVDKLILDIQDKDLYIKEINISNKFYEVVNTGILKINTQNSIISGNIAITKLSLYSKKDNVKNIYSNMVINLDKQFINFNNLDVNIDFSKDVVLIQAKDLSKLSLHNLFDNLLDGYATASIGNTKLNMQLSLKNQTTPLFYKNKALEDIELIIKSNLDTNKTYLYGLNGDFKIQIHSDNIEIHTNNIDLNISDLNISNTQNTKDINIYSKNSKMLVKDYIFDFDKIKTNITKGNLAINASKNGSKITLKKIDKKINLIGSKIKSDFLNTVIGKATFKEGLFNITMANKQLATDDFYGTLEAKNTYIKNLSTINNIFSLINISPMGLSANGLKVETTKILYEIKKNKLILDPISLYSDSVNIIGRGVIDIETKDINLYIKTSIFKTLNTIVKTVPIVNHIILGENGDMNINMLVKGKLGNTNIQLDNNQDIIKQPFEIILRTLTLPQKIIQGLIN